MFVDSVEQLVIVASQENVQVAELGEAFVKSVEAFVEYVDAGAFDADGTLTSVDALLEHLAEAEAVIVELEGFLASLPEGELTADQLALLGAALDLGGDLKGSLEDLDSNLGEFYARTSTPTDEPPTTQPSPPPTTQPAPPTTRPAPEGLSDEELQQERETLQQQVRDLELRLGELLLELWRRGLPPFPPGSGPAPDGGDNNR